MEATSSRAQRKHIQTAARHIASGVCALGLLTASTLATAAPAVFPDASVQGNNARLSLNATFYPDSAHAGQDIRVFALAWVPNAITAQGPQGRWFARSSQGWRPVGAGEVWPEALALPTGILTQPLNLIHADDVRLLMGARLYLGYGLSSGDTASAMNEMLAQGRYRQIYTLNQSPSDTGRSTNSNGDVALEPANAERLQALFEQVQKINADRYYSTINAVGTSPVPMPAPVPAPAPPPPPSGATSSDSAAIVSGTTLQEVGVDEDDVVKTDGKFVYNLGTTSQGVVNNFYYGYAPRDLLQRRQFSTSEVALSKPDELVLPWSKTSSSGTGLFLDSERQQIVAMAKGDMNSTAYYDMWFTSTYWQTGLTELAVVDASAMKVKRHLRLNGALIGSRRIGSTLYLVLRSYPQWPTPMVFTAGANKESTSTTTTLAKTELPTFSLDQGPNQPLVNAADCLIPNGKTEANTSISADTITLVAVDLAAQTHKHSARCFVGNTEAFYMSERHVYLATTRYAYTYSGGFPVYAPNTYTDIHQFALNGLEMNYQGSGSVVGHLGFDQNRKSFRMGEYNGVLRVFTQTAQSFGGWTGISVPVATSNPATTTSTATTTTTSLVPPAQTDSPGKLTLLQARDGALVTVGELPNAKRPAPLGKPGEQLYASRFMGNRGYLVTYRLIDPLYIIDLSNPTDPQVLGELEVSGYSDYLFPLSDSLLLGVGKDAIADTTGMGDGRAAWYQGVKLSLIDISNPAKPVEAARSIIGKRGTDATVLHNHHGIALQTRPDSVRVSLPISLNDTPTSYTTGRPNDYYNFTRNELQKFEIDLQAKTLNARTPLVSTGPYRDISNDRSVLWNDQVHYYMGKDWLSAPW